MAHVAVTTTLPVLDCLWFEKKQHTLAKNNFNTSKRPSASKSCKAHTCLLSLPTIHTKNSGPHGEGRALIPKQPECSLRQHLRDTDSGKPAQLTEACRSTNKLFQKPNQPRLLSTSYKSWHSIYNAIWQLKAAFATSQSCKSTESNPFRRCEKTKMIPQKLRTAPRTERVLVVSTRAESTPWPCGTPQRLICNLAILL